MFRVIYSIDVGASDFLNAAETAWKIMRAEDALFPVLIILDSEGEQMKIDLSEHLEIYKITPGFVSQRYRKQRTGKFKCIDQEFIAGDDVQFENLNGEPVNPPEHDYQPFNMTMISNDKIINRLTCILSVIDTGSEQSRAFAEEIKSINELLKDLG